MAEQSNRNPPLAPVPVSIREFKESWVDVLARYSEDDPYNFSTTIDEGFKNELEKRCRVDDELKYSSQFFLDATLFSLLRQYRDKNLEEIEQQERRKHEQLYNTHTKNVSQNGRPQPPKKRSARDAGDGRDDWPTDPSLSKDGQEEPSRKRKLVAQSKIPAILSAPAVQKGKGKEPEKHFGDHASPTTPQQQSATTAHLIPPPITPVMSTNIANLALPPSSSTPLLFEPQENDAITTSANNWDLPTDDPEGDGCDLYDPESMSTTLEMRYRDMADTLDSSCLASLKDSNRSIVPLRYRWEVNYLSVPAAEKTREISVRIAHPETILSIAVYQPNRPHSRLQEYFVLGSQKLTALRDAIYCLSDFLTYGADQSGEAKIVNDHAKKLSASYFFIENVFYVDHRLPGEDYSKVILDWLEQNNRQTHPGLGILTSKTMDDFTWEDLGIRVNHPYLFVHQGDCEHLMMIRDLRMIRRDDEQDLSVYPLPVFRCKINRNKCRMCGVYPAKYVTINDIYSGETPCYFCHHCYGPFHYDERGRLLYDDYHVFPYSHD